MWRECEVTNGDKRQSIRWIKMRYFLLASLLLSSDGHLVTPVCHHRDWCFVSHHVTLQYNNLVSRIWAAFGDSVVKLPWPFHCDRTPIIQAKSSPPFISQGPKTKLKQISVRQCGAETGNLKYGSPSSGGKLMLIQAPIWWLFWETRWICISNRYRSLNCDYSQLTS